MKMKYVTDPDPTNPLEGKIDRFLEQRVVSMKNAFLGELFSRYDAYFEMEEASVLPEAMTEATHEAFKTMDPLRNFIHATYQRTQSADCYVTTREVKAAVRAWAQKNDVSLPSKDADLMSDLDRIFEGRVMTNEQRKITIPGTSVRGWRYWRALEDDGGGDE